jgi:hypothetical protein
MTARSFVTYYVTDVETHVNAGQSIDMVMRKRIWPTHNYNIFMFVCIYTCVRVYQTCLTGSMWQLQSLNDPLKDMILKKKVVHYLCTFQRSHLFYHKLSIMMRRLQETQGIPAGDSGCPLRLWCIAKVNCSVFVSGCYGDAIYITIFAIIARPYTQPSWNIVSASNLFGSLWASRSGNVVI